MVLYHSFSLHFFILLYNMLSVRWKFFMTKAYYLKVLDDIVKDSKYFQNEAIDFYLLSEQFKPFYYDSFGSFFENI